METGEERIVVIMPALNEEETIGEVIRECREALSGKNNEILVVDGRSSDDTVKRSRQEGAYVIVQKGTGYGDALVCGFGYALRILKPDIVIMMDADGTYPPQSINDLLKPIFNDEADLVIGNRFAVLDKKTMPLVNRIGNRFLSGLSKLLFKMPLLDTQSGFRAFRAEILSNMVFKNPGMPLASEMIVEAKNANYRISQIPVTYRSRRGKSKLRPLRDGWFILGTMIRLYRDFSPLFFFGLIGSFFLTIAGILTLYLLITYFVAGVVPNFVFGITIAVMFVSGLIIVVMGLLADMIKDMRERLRVFEIQLAENFLQNKNARNSQPHEETRASERAKE